MGPSLRWEDKAEINNPYIVIPAQAGIQCLKQ
jgi:hypothetical protein